jgi:hypothetical protein
MNIIHTFPVASLGYDFIEPRFLPKGKDEYFLRNQQLKNKGRYKKLTAQQRAILQSNGNTASNWNDIRVSAGFDPTLVHNCRFFGLVRIGDLKPSYHEFHNLRIAEGLYNSTIISADIGDHVCIDQVRYLSHYIIDEYVMLVNINELACTDKAKFGNGILKQGETDEKRRIVIEICNENGGRSIIPFDGMLAGDAYLWSRYRSDKLLMKRFRELTEKKFDAQRGYYGRIGARTVIKNSLIIKDTLIGSDAYIKGANKLKNLTINSDADRKTQIGEGCELVNGIVGYGCRIFYGVKAVRFITASHSQLKYGARLINSYLGNNSTISCCEVLNTMVFPAHEQHHNNSFLCASLVMGQSNIAAGATIGSNHNSRGADGEIIAGRGFWPGLCVSLKHNSRFASFTIIAKGDYPAELDIPIPFSLISQDMSNDRLVVMPAYWFMYNMYALARNAWKYEDRDKRIHKMQTIEFDYLGPDTINEIMDAIRFLQKLKPNEKDEAIITGWENSKRKILITKVSASLAVYRQLVHYYFGSLLINQLDAQQTTNYKKILSSMRPEKKRSHWINTGGQLIQADRIDALKKAIKAGKINQWEQVHRFYHEEGEKYSQNKLRHAYTCYLELESLKPAAFTKKQWIALLQTTGQTKRWMTTGIRTSREKDYQNPFRAMVYENRKEMDVVIGPISENSFILNQEKALRRFERKIATILSNPPR